MHPPRVRLPSLLFWCALIGISFTVRMEMLSATVVRAAVVGDARDYFAYAYNLRHHQVYSKDFQGLPPRSQRPEADALRPPGYPVFLSLFMDATPNQRTFFWIGFVQVLISTLTVGISYFIYKRFLPRGWAETAAILVALSPHLITMNLFLLTETLFCFALCAAAWVFDRVTLRPSTWGGIALGATLGLANLIRPSLLFFMPAIALYFLFHLKSRDGIKASVLVLAGFMIAVAPWHVRNRAAIEKWSDERLQINFLHHGMYPDFMYDHQKESYGSPYLFDPRSGAISRSTGSVLSEIADRFRREPLEHIAWYLFKKPAAYWSWDIVPGPGDVFALPVTRTPYWENGFFMLSHRMMKHLHTLATVLGLMGCVLAWVPAAGRRLDRLGLASARFFSLLLAYYTTLHVIGAPFPRYSIPLRPFLYGMGAFAAAWAWGWGCSRFSAIRVPSPSSPSGTGKNG